MKLLQFHLCNHPFLSLWPDKKLPLTAVFFLHFSGGWSLRRRTNFSELRATAQVLEIFSICSTEIICEDEFINIYLVSIKPTSHLNVNPHSIVCLNVKELLAPNRRNLWSLSDCNGIRTHIHLVRKGTLNHFAKLTKSNCVTVT